MRQGVEPGRRPGADPEPASGGTVGAMRLLVVEDEADLADAVARACAATAMPSTSPPTARRRSTSSAFNEYDLVCLDITMPGIDGREVCRQHPRADRHVDPSPRVLDAHRPRLARGSRGGPRRRRRRLPRQAVRVPRAAGPGALAAAARRRHDRPPCSRVGDLELDTARHAAAARRSRSSSSPPRSSRSCATS